MAAHRRARAHHGRLQPSPGCLPPLTNPLPPPLVRSPTELYEDLNSYLASALAPGTQSNLRTALKHFDTFLVTQPHRQPFVTPRWDGDMEASLHNEMTFMLFAIYLAREDKRQASTVLNYCSLARSHISSVVGFPLTTGTPRWKRLTRALRKRHRRERRECRALRTTHLRRAFTGILAQQSPIAVNRWATVVVGMHLLARPTELTNLRRSHLTWMLTPEPHAVVMLHPLKKGPEQTPVPMLIAVGDGSGADAYAALRRLEDVDPVVGAARAHTPLFRDERRRAPSVPVISGWVQRVASAAGEGGDAGLFTARALRIGGATELHAMGANQLTIMLLGRWSSDVSRLYTRVSQGQVLALSAAISRAPEDPSLEQVFHSFVQSARR